MDHQAAGENVRDDEWVQVVAALAAEGRRMAVEEGTAPKEQTEGPCWMAGPEEQEERWTVELETVQETKHLEIGLEGSSCLLLRTYALQPTPWVKFQTFPSDLHRRLWDPEVEKHHWVVVSALMDLSKGEGIRSVSFEAQDVSGFCLHRPAPPRQKAGVPICQLEVVLRYP